MTWQSDLFAAPRPMRSGPARGTRRRLSPRAAFQDALWGRALLVDIRPAEQRRAEGSLPVVLTPLVIEHATLGARLGPRSPERLPIASPELPVVVICQEGAASSEAADALALLGVRHATDVIGGFAAWRSLGLPVAA
jgi:rhodanese-related sulfurtransferase